MILSPKEKAKELVEYYAETVKPIDFGVMLERDWKTSKQCALIAVDEIIKALRKSLPEIGKGKGYWYSVKQEIKKL